MKTTKMSLANIQGKLSRNEMKNVIGGSQITSCSCTGSPGSWTYTSTDPIPIAVCVRDVATYCPGGNGSCRALALQSA